MNKISEKAVWDDLVPSDDEKLSSPSYGQPIQPQMMFCYKCSQVIPANSAFCPWCQTELFVSCPKCGSKYSSQYPSCNQCGTNRESYILEQQKLEARRIEEERRKEVKRQQLLEEQRRKEAENEARRREVDRLKAKREEEERQRSIAAERERMEKEKKMQEQYVAENKQIIKTEEYLLAYSTINEAYERFRTKHKGYFILFLLIFLVLCIPACLVSFGVEPYDDWIFNLPDGIYEIVVYSHIVIPLLYALFGSIYLGIKESTKNCAQFVEKYISSLKITETQELLGCSVKNILNYSGSVKSLSSELQNIIISAYREVYILKSGYTFSRKIRCGNCGFSSTITEIPSVCPICGAPSIVFEKI